MTSRSTSEKAASRQLQSLQLKHDKLMKSYQEQEKELRQVRSELKEVIMDGDPQSWRNMDCGSSVTGFSVANGRALRERRKSEHGNGIHMHLPSEVVNKEMLLRELNCAAFDTDKHDEQAVLSEVNAVLHRNQVLLNFNEMEMKRIGKIKDSLANVLANMGFDDKKTVPLCEYFDFLGHHIVQLERLKIILTSSQKTLADKLKNGVPVLNRELEMPIFPEEPVFPFSAVFFDFYNNDVASAPEASSGLIRAPSMPSFPVPDSQAPVFTARRQRSSSRTDLGNSRGARGEPDREVAANVENVFNGESHAATTTPGTSTAKGRPNSGLLGDFIRNQLSSGGVPLHTSSPRHSFTNANDPKSATDYTLNLTKASMPQQGIHFPNAQFGYLPGARPSRQRKHSEGGGKAASVASFATVASSKSGRPSAVGERMREIQKTVEEIMGEQQNPNSIVTAVSEIYKSNNGTFQGLTFEEICKKVASALKKLDVGTSFSRPGSVAIGLAKNS